MQKRQVFNLLQYKEVEVIGSAGDKNLKFPADIDLQEKITTDKDYDDIYKFFLNIYQKSHKNPNVFITDFKLGFHNGKGIHWTYEDMINGYVVKSDIKYPFKFALNQKSTIKIDAIVLLNKEFVEFSINYYFTFVKFNHKNTHDFTRKQIQDMLINNYHVLMSKGKVYKALKRLYSYYKKINKKKEIKKLETLFNSDLGKLYKQKSSLETIDLLLNNNFRKVEMSDIKHNLLLIKNNLPDSYKDDINKLIKSPNNKMIKQIIDKLDDNINKQTKDWLQSNDFRFII